MFKFKIEKKDVYIPRAVVGDIIINEEDNFRSFYVDRITDGRLVGFYLDSPEYPEEIWMKGDKYIVLSHATKES